MSLEYQISVCVCVYKCIYMYMCVFVYFEVRKSKAKAKAKALRNLRFVISFLNYSNIFPLSWPLLHNLSSLQPILHTTARVLVWKINWILSLSSSNTSNKSQHL